MKTFSASSVVLRKAFLLLFILHSSLFTALAQTLSPNAKVSLITIAPGVELYSSFGHSALWISDPTTGLDRNYNYGTFNFRTGNFYLKFLRGTLPYQLAVYPLSLELPYWQADNRRVTEQELNLSYAQKQKLFNLLETNYLPQNREYAYKFFYDNCSTRLRDMLQAACGDSLQFSNQPIDGQAKSFRQWMNRYLIDRYWAQFGMNAAIGTPADALATPAQEMYLPNNLMGHVERAKLGGKPLVLQERFLFSPNDSSIKANWQVYLSPSFIFMMLFFLLILIQWLRPEWLNRRFWFDKFFFGLVGFWGCFVLLLWVATDHGVTNWNQNLLWLMPLHLPFAFLLGKPQHQKMLLWYVSICFWLLVGVYALLFLGPLWKETQWIPWSAVALIVMIGVRLIAIKKRLTTV
jgi:Domain of unknown function (DUF4105)